jgi:transcriptional regulator of acetoin/glycerol metabolism
MVSGPDAALAAFAGAARSELREPVRIVSCASPLFLEGSTLLLTDVEMLDEAGQHRLLRWMNETRNVDTQVIALSSDPLFAKVCAQRFNADLYYRLNTILIELSNK